MTEEKIETIGWDEALENSDYISFKEDESKEIVITGWRFERRPADSKIGGGKVELIANVLEEDGEKVEKMLTTTSNRLKTKLKPILEGKADVEKVKLSILKVGDKFDTQYSVKELK